MIGKKTLKKASVENLLHALGALYILNLYYTDERTDIDRVYLSDHDFDTLRWVILRWKIQRNKIKIY